MLKMIQFLITLSNFYILVHIVLLKMKLTIFAFALLYQVLVLYIVVATFAEEPGPAKRRKCIIEQLNPFRGQS